MDDGCAECGSGATRRGGRIVWTVDLILILLAVPVVLTGRVNAALVAAILLAVMAIAHLSLGERFCSDCGSQWRDRDRNRAGSRDDN